MRHLLTLVVFILALAGVSSCARKQEQATTAVPVVQGAKIEMVALQPIDESYEAVGTVRAKTSIIVSSKVMGNIVL